MKIVISADIEGASGIASFRECGYPRLPVGDPQANPDYLSGRRWLTGDINAAVEGAIEAGATQFIVHDSHGLDYRNVVLDELHPAVEVVRGMPILFYEQADLSNSYDAAFLIAMHDRGGQPGVLSHSLSWPLLYELRINNQPVGESQITVELAGYYKIPTVLITGDDLVCKEIKSWTDGNIQTAVVKYALSRYAARCLPLTEARNRIREAAKQAVQKAQECRPTYFKSPYTLEVDFIDRQIASYVAWMPEIQYDGNCTVSYSSSDFLQIYKALLAIFCIATSTMNP